MRGRALLAAVALALAASACARPAREAALDDVAVRRAVDRADPDRLRDLADRAAAGAASLAQARALADAAARDGDPVDRAFAARLAEAAGDLPTALLGHLEVAADAAAPAWARAWAATRGLALVDRVALLPAHARRLAAALAAPDPLPGAVADFAEAVALRRGDGPLRALARRRAGRVTAYRHVGPVAGDPALAFAAWRRAPPPGAEGAPWPDAAAWREEATPDGAVALAGETPGLHLVAFPAPASDRPLEVEVAGEAATRLRAGGDVLADNDRLGAWGAARVVVPLPPGPARELTLEVASRAPSTTLRVAVRPAPPGPADPGGARLPARLARLDLALADEDLARADAAAAALAEAARGLAAVGLARLEALDVRRPASLSRPVARRLLEDALAAVPDLAEARDALAVELLATGEVATAEAVLAGGPSGVAGVEARLALARERGRLAEAGRLAEDLQAARPTSCAALDALLDLRWDRLRLAPGRLPAPLPGCPDTRLRVAGLLREGRAFAEADRLLDGAAADAAPGPERARVQEARAQVAYQRGDLAEVARRAEAGLAAGAGAEPLLALLRRTAELAGDRAAAARWSRALLETPGVSSEGRRPVLDPAEDLGLPLADGEALALEALRRAEAGEEGARAPVDVLLHDHRVRVLADGAMIHRVHLAFHVLDEAAAESWGEVPLPRDAEILLARTWKPTPDGRMQPIEPEDLMETGAVSLTALEAGAVGEVAWTWMDEPQPGLWPAWIAPWVPLARDDASVRLARLTLRAPPGAAVAFRTTGGLPPPRPAGPATWVAEVRGRDRVLQEPLDPRPDRRLAGVQASVALGLADLRARYLDDLVSRLRGGPAVRALAEEALRDAGPDARARARALHGLVLQRIQEGDGGLFAGGAELTAASRAGERSVLLVALCDAAGLSAELVLARPRSRGEPPAPGAPAEPDDWIYPLVRVAVPGGEVWLDTSSRFAPFDYLPPLVQGVEGLRLAAGGDALVRTPTRAAADGVRRIAITLRVAPDGAWRAEGEETLTGLYAMGWRHVLADLVADVRERALAGVVQQSLPGARLARLDVRDLEAREVPLGLRWEAEGRVDGQGARRHLTLGLSPEGLAQATVQVPERETPLLLDRQERVELTLRVELPPGWTIAQPPGDAAVSHPRARLSREVAWDPAARALTVVKRFALDLGIVPPEAYPAWVEAARQVDRADVVHLELAAGG